MSDDRMIFKPAKCAGYITAFINVDVFLELSSWVWWPMREIFEKSEENVELLT